MKSLKLPLFLFFSIVLLVTKYHAQSFSGQGLDSYGGIHSVILNPADVVNPFYRADINLFSISGLAGSDYFAININSALNGEEGFDFDSEVNRYPKDNNQFFFNTEILGPSFMFNLSEKHSIAITSRIRGIMNLNNINGYLYENLEDNFENPDDFDFIMKDFSGTIHAWGEIGLTYGRTLIDNENKVLKAGITLKLLQGAGSSYFQTPNLSGEYTANSGNLATTGNLKYGFSQDFESDDIDFKNLSSGLGGDIGISYIIMHNKAKDSLKTSSNQKFKIGLSITDLGKISYKESQVTSYDLNKTVNREIFFEDDLKNVLMENYDGVETIENSKINLPTAAHLILDYQLRKRIYLSMHGMLSLIGDTDTNANRVLNSLTISPRLQMRWLSLYIPVSIRQYDGLAAGAGLRLGPLTIGSASLLSNLMSDESKSIDVYGGIKIPLYKK